MITNFKLFESTDLEIIFNHIISNTDIYIINKWIQDNKVNIDITNDSGWTPLMIAAIHNKYEITKLFIDNGANINHKTKDGMNVLLLYCIFNNNNIESSYKLIDLFIKNNINWKLIYSNNMFLDFLSSSIKNNIIEKYPEIKNFYKKFDKKRKFNI
jgi:ankyrin repeat protein